MVLNRPCQYALIAMAHLAEQQPGHLTPIREISKQSRVPLPFLAKILGTLSRHGIIVARRGPNGGVMLSRPAQEVSLGEVVEVLDNSLGPLRCYLGLPRCDERHPCPMHDTWVRMRTEMRKTLARRTLEDLTQTSGWRQVALRRKTAKRGEPGRSSRRKTTRRAPRRR